MENADFNTFFDAFLDTLFWATTIPVDREGECVPLDDLHDVADLDPRCREYLKKGAFDFFSEFHNFFQKNYGIAGRNLALSSQGHGAGFFDSGLEKAGILQEAARCFGSFEPSIIDGKVFC